MGQKECRVISLFLSRLFTYQNWDDNAMGPKLYRVDLEEAKKVHDKRPESHKTVKGHCTQKTESG